jgi:hypothetical protein
MAGVANYEVVLVNRTRNQRWSRCFTAFQFCCVPLILWWIPYQHLPPPGWAVALLAMAAAAMSIHEGMKDWQKLFWIVIMTAMLITELRAINKERDKAYWDSVTETHRREVEEARQQDRFEANMKGFENLLAQDKAILRTTQGAASTAQEGIASMMGTDSYLLAIPQHIFPATPSNQDSFGFMLFPIGKHIIWDGEVVESEGQLDESFYSRPQKVIELKPITLSHASGLGITIQPSRDKDNWYAFSFSSRANGGGENLLIRFNQHSNSWEFQYWLYRLKIGMKKPEPPVVLKHQDWEPIPSPVMVQAH